MFDRILLIAILVWLHAVSSSRVYYSSTKKNGNQGEYFGSTEGETLLWIYGSGFAPRDFDTTPSTTTSNRVQLYRPDAAEIYDCAMEPEEIGTTQLGCYTPSMPDGFYRLRIFVNGRRLSDDEFQSLSSTGFQSSSERTPVIDGISPSIGFPRRLVRLTGNFKTSCYAPDATVCSSAQTSFISRQVNIVDPAFPQTQSLEFTSVDICAIWSIQRTTRCECRRSLFVCLFFRCISSFFLCAGIPF